MHATLITIHVIVSFSLIGIVLLQQGKGAEMGAAFGGSSQTLFGSTGATTLLGKLTATAAAVFMLTSLGLTYLSANRYKATVVSESPAATAPAQPAAPAPATPTEVPKAPEPTPAGK